MENQIKNYAFISYSHQDAKVARWLQHKLEQYYIPDKVFNKAESTCLPPTRSHYLRPVFLDKTDLTGGVLADTLQANLDASQYLIVICSPNSAKSEWVSKEVQHFIYTGRLDHIIPFVIDGIPYIDSQIAAGKNPVGEECMPKSLIEFTNRHPEKELLGIDYRENGSEGSVMRIISQMLGISFDEIWNRQARRKRSEFTALTSAAIAVLLILGYMFIPIKLTYKISNYEQAAELPLPDDAVLTIEGTEYNLGSNLDTTIVLTIRPGYYRGRTFPVVFTATYFDTIRTEIDLGFGFFTDDILYLHRNNMFAIFAGHVLDQEGDPIAGAKVSVRQNSVTTDEDGAFRIVLPPSEQAEEQAIIIEKFGYYDVYRPDECSSDNLTYIMYKVN